MAINLSLRPELQLILNCARTRVDDDVAARIRSLLQNDLDWQDLRQVALEHRVLPLVYHTLNATAPNAAPKSVMADLQKYFYHNAGRNLFLTRELLKILALLDAARIFGIPYKGPALAASAYSNLALREFGDLDILVRQNDYQRAGDILIGQGFRRTIEHEWETEFINDAGTAAVDLHKRIAPREFPSSLNFEHFENRLRPVTLADVTTNTLDPADTLLVLSIQVAKDSHFQLGKICDIAELLGRHQDWDWKQALGNVKRLGGRRIVLFALQLTHQILGTAFPQPFEDELRSVSFASVLLRNAPRHVFAVCGDNVRAPSGERLDWLLRDRLRDKVRPYYFRYVLDAMTPGELERKLLPLPKQLSFLYFAIRPIRLSLKYGLAVARFLLFRRKN